MKIEAKYECWSVWDLLELKEEGFIDFEPIDVEDWWVKWDELHIKLKGSNQIVKLDGFGVSESFDWKRPDEIFTDGLGTKQR